MAGLAGETVSVYDRTLVYHLANHGLEAKRAVRLAAARGDTTRARSQLQAALDLDASFDPFQVNRARETVAGLR